MIITPTPIPCIMQETTGQGKSIEESGHDQQQMKEQEDQRQQAKGKEVQTGKPSRNNISKTNVTNTDVHLHNVDTNKQEEANRPQQGNDRANMDYHHNFPRISNNYASMILISKGLEILLIRITTPQLRAVRNSQTINIMYNQSKNEIPIELDNPIHTTRQGLPAVLLEENDYNIKLAESCKYTLVGKFTNIMPKVDLIRRSFIRQTQLSRGAWTPEFKPEEETPLVPLWIALSELPWHCYNKVLLTTILSSIGKVLYLDSPSSQKTRGSMDRVKVQIDITKERPPHV
ncbi:hypothetical protein KY285_035786 [Solanum tuberosum]|nr:hypothetical protein KY285_035786 [Solanum tuberosum]